jgi:hypothetical protein
MRDGSEARIEPPIEALIEADRDNGEVGKV